MSAAITIHRDAAGFFTVFTGTHVHDKMGRDEALYVVAQWIMGAPNEELRYGHKIESYWEMKRAIRAEIEAELRPVDRLTLKP